MAKEFFGQEFLTVDEVAAGLRVSAQTIRNWSDAGRLPHVRMGPTGRRVRILRSDLNEFLARSVTGLSQPPPGPSAESFWGGP